MFKTTTKSLIFVVVGVEVAAVEMSISGFFDENVGILGLVLQRRERRQKNSHLAHDIFVTYAYSAQFMFSIFWIMICT